MIERVRLGILSGTADPNLDLFHFLPIDASSEGCWRKGGNDEDEEDTEKSELHCDKEFSKATTLQMARTVPYHLEVKGLH